MIVSVHLPKTAGMSFVAALEARYPSSLLRDYADKPINVPVPERHAAVVAAGREIAAKDFAGVDCVHGHFMPVKYLPLAERQSLCFITWLRNPVDRLLSHYHFWRRDYQPQQAGALRRRMVEEDWTVERFCLGEEMRDFYQQFLWSFPVGKFSFIGITEHFESDLRYFGEHYLGMAPSPVKTNTGPNQGQAYPIDADFRHQIEQHHAKDMALYYEALQMAARRAD